MATKNINEVMETIPKQGNYKQVPRKNIADGFYNPEKDCIDNMNPACFSCNNYKHTMSLDNFRKQIGLLVDRLNKNFTQYKIAKRYGLVSEIEKEVTFYFERTGSSCT